MAIWSHMYTHHSSYLNSYLVQEIPWSHSEVVYHKHQILFYQTYLIFPMLNINSTYNRTCKNIWPENSYKLVESRKLQKCQMAISSCMYTHHSSHLNTYLAQEIPRSHSEVVYRKHQILFYQRHLICLLLNITSTYNRTYI